MAETTLRGTLMEITRPSGEFAWLSILDEPSGHFWVFDFTTRRFHINTGLATDYVIDHELVYKAIDLDTARQIANNPTHTTRASVTRAHQTDPRSASAEPVLSDQGLSDTRTAVTEKARAVAAADPGAWVVWKVYTEEQEATARVAASDIRHGKIKVLTRVAGPVESRWQRRNGHIEVQVARKAPA